MLATILALKAWAVYRIAKMVSSFVRMGRSVSLRKYAVVKRSFDIMLEKLYWGILYGVRGSIYAVIFMVLSLVLQRISYWLYSSADNSLLEMMAIQIAKGISLLAMASIVVGVVVWLFTWLSDYQDGYLPNWIRRELY